MARYFDRFPVINYDGVVAKNILARVDFTQQTKRDIYSNFDYTLTEHSARPDTLSYNYYNSSQYDWLIYMSNDVVDPYHDYYKTENDMQLYLQSKYGSIGAARQKILYYRNDWSSDDSSISPIVYDALTDSIKKYWQPIRNNTGVIISYERTQQDWIVSTNKIVRLEVADASGFTLGERVLQDTTVCYGEITSVDLINNAIIVKNVTGEFIVDEFIQSVSLLSQTIPDEESAFWAAVSAYDHEMELNESKKHINMIKSSYLPDVEKLFLEQIRK